MKLIIWIKFELGEYTFSNVNAFSNVKTFLNVNLSIYLIFRQNLPIIKIKKIYSFYF